MEAAYTSLYLWKGMVEKANSFAVPDVQAAAGGVTFDAPEGMVTVNGDNQHIAKTALHRQDRAGRPDLHRLVVGQADRARPVPQDLPLGERPRADRHAGPGGRSPRGPPGSHLDQQFERTRRGQSSSASCSPASASASVLLLIALGLALTFGQMGVINMAHGEFIMAGAYTAYVAATESSAAPACRCWSSLPIAFVVAGLLGVLLEVTLHPPHVRTARWTRCWSPGVSR